MVHRSGLRPADGEKEPNYWLDYSSGPRTDQHYDHDHIMIMGLTLRLVCIYMLLGAIVKKDATHFH
jgi:hypothetical protein